MPVGIIEIKKVVRNVATYFFGKYKMEKRNKNIYFANVNFHDMVFKNFANICDTLRDWVSNA